MTGPQGADLGAAMQALADLIVELRTKCPWDREQTHESLVKYIEEESAEVVETIHALEAAPDRDADAAYDDLAEELGDLLLQVVLHANLAAEQGRFTLADVAERLHVKLVRRHPHVFSDFVADTAEEVNANWERIKQAERDTRTPPPTSRQ